MIEGANAAYRMGDRESAFLRKRQEVVPLLNDLLPVLRAHAGEGPYRVELHGEGEFAKVFVLVPFCGSAEEALSVVDRIAADRQQLGQGQGRLVQVDVEFVGGERSGTGGMSVAAAALRARVPVELHASFDRDFEAAQTSDQLLDVLCGWEATLEVDADPELARALIEGKKGPFLAVELQAQNGRSK